MVGFDQAASEAAALWLAALRMVGYLRGVDGRDGMQGWSVVGGTPDYAGPKAFVQVVRTDSYPIPPTEDDHEALSRETPKARCKATALRP